MDALVVTRGVLSRAFNLISGKSIGQGCDNKRMPKPVISEQQILIKIRAVALNPIDYKHIDSFSARDNVLGCDYAGEVEQVGKHAPGNWKIGDRVAGFVHGGQYSDSGSGSFAQYVKTDGDLAWHVPAEISDEEAATYGLTSATAMLGLKHLNFPSMDEVMAGRIPQVSATGKKNTILVYSGSTAVGLSAIQLAKKAGYTVVTTASPKSFDLVKQYGADEVFDYRSSTAVQDIVRQFPDITQALDCISQGPSFAFCAQVLKANGGKVVTLGPAPKKKLLGVEFEFLMVFTAFGKEFAMLPPIGPVFPVDISARDAFVSFNTSMPELVKTIKAPPVRLVGKGFEKIIEGLQDLRQGKVSGQKLVVKI